ncbi:AsmA family protein [Methylomicrobium lacus]|uniref:AsmA family protein n=1 Tax=Methylomicrobium lacus TaxID=136992 RepID=UPI0035A9A4E9
MRKPLKVFAVIFALSILLIGSALGVLSVVIDPNQFKPQLAETLRQKIGREVEFAGDLRWSVFPWLGVSVGPMRIKNVEGFRQADFLGIEQGEIKVKVLPLLGKRLEIDRIELKGLRLNLLRNKEGGNNWGRVGSASEEAVEPTSPGQAAQDKPGSPENAWAVFAVGGVMLEEAAVHWDDQQTGQRLDVENINLNVGKLMWDQFADVALTFIVVGPSTGYRDRISLKTRVRVKQNFEQVSLAGAELSLAREEKKRPGKDLSAMLTAPEIRFEKNAQKLWIAKLQIESGELAVVSSLKGSHLFEAADVEGHLEMAEFNPGKLLKRFDIALPKFQDPGALGRLQAGFDWHVAQNALSLDALRCKLDDTLLQGKMRIEGWEAPAIRFNLAADTLDAGRYLPKNKTPQLTPAAALAGAFSMLPAGQLRKLDAQGEVSLGHLQMHGITADELRLQLNAKDGVVQTR